MPKKRSRRRLRSWKPIIWLGVAAAVVLGLAWYSLPSDYWNWLRAQVSVETTSTVKGCCYVATKVPGERSAIKDVLEADCQKEAKKQFPELAEREKQVEEVKHFCRFTHTPGLFVPGKCETDFHIAYCGATKGKSTDKPAACEIRPSERDPKTSEVYALPILGQTCQDDLNKRLQTEAENCLKQDKILEKITEPQLTWELGCLFGSGVPTKDNPSGYVGECEQEWAQVFRCVAPTPAPTASGQLRGPVEAPAEAPPQSGTVLTAPALGDPPPGYRLNSEGLLQPIPAP